MNDYTYNIGKVDVVFKILDVQNNSSKMYVTLDGLMLQQFFLDNINLQQQQEGIFKNYQEAKNLWKEQEQFTVNK